MKFVALVLMVILLDGCRSKSPRDAGFFGAGGDRLAPATEFAHCRRPSLSPRGRRLLAICEHQRTHSHPQLYVIDLETGENRRVTWQDGEVTEALWIDAHQIAYASTTDEVKERMFRPPQPLSRDPQTEIYLSDLYGNEIIRLTENPGFDGEMTLEGNELSHVSLRDGRREVWRRHLTINRAEAAPVSLNDSTIFFPVALPQRRWIWLSTQDLARDNFSWRWFAKETPPIASVLNPVRLRRTSGGQGILIVDRLEKGDRLLWLSTDWSCLKEIWNEETRISSADLVEGTNPVLALGRVTPTGSRVQVVTLAPASLSCAEEASAPKMNP